ncbi:tape measure protein [Mycolicibacterium boenickei]|nr:tape measure protein [Mycolicibacterium boenickei]
MASGIELATAYVSLVGDTAKLSKSINAAFTDAERASVKSGNKIGQNLNTSIGQGLGGTKGAAAKAGADAAREYERALQSSIRGEKIGTAIGSVIGKGIGLGIKAGIGVAALGATAAVGLLTASLTKGFTRLKNIDEATFKLKALGNTAADVQKIIQSSQKAVKGTAFGLDEAITGAASAVAAGVRPGDDLTQYLSNIADTAAIAGTSFEEMASIFNKVQTNNKAYTDDLQQLSDRGINVFKYLQNQYGVTGDELSKMVQDGKVSSADFLKAIQSNLGGAGKIMGQSFTGSVQNAEAAMGRFGEALLKPAFGQAAGGIGSITSALDGLTMWVNNNQDKIVGFWAAIGKGAIAGTQDVLKTVASMIEGFAQFQNAIGDILGGMNKFQAWGKDLGGQHEEADALRAQAEEFFSWGTGAAQTADKIYGLIDSLDSGKAKIDEWAERSKHAAALTQALGDSIVAIPDGKSIVLDDNAPEVEAKLDALGIKLETLPDGKVTLVPNTPEAQAVIDAFLQKNSPTPPAKVPVEPDVAAAQIKVDDFIKGITNQVVSIPVDIHQVPRAGDPGVQIGGPPPAGFPAPNRPSEPGQYVPYDPKAWERPKFGGGRARGGPIGGSGPKGKDSVHIMAAPGEHMLTASEVDMLGGQGGAYALRAAIRAGAIGKQGVVMFPPEPIGPSDKNNPGGVPDLRPGKNPNQIGLPDWSTPGQGWGSPPPGWWTKPINPDDYLLPEWWPPGHDYWKHPYDKNKIKPFGVPGYENGGAIGAIDYAYNAAGQKYQYGAFDCSMLASQVYARMSGQPPGRYFTTDSDFAALGFKKGYKPGALNIGTNGGSGTNGHMAVTLPNGVNAENAGSAGSMYGGAAKGANDFSQQWYYEPPNAGDMGDLQANGMQASGMQTHGMTAGAAPGPVGADGQPVTPGSGATPTDSGRTEGYIPAGAGNTSVAGTSFMSGIYNMGAEAINGLIDQAASAASTAASMGAFGAPGSGQGAALAIGMGANAAKRGVSYGAQMLGIGTDALVEQLTPFGAPRWLSTDPTAFMPQGLTSAATTSLEQAQQGGDQPQAAGQQPVDHQGSGAPPGPAVPQLNLPPQNPEDLQPAEGGITINGGINGMDPDQVGNELLKVQRYNALQYQGRP